MLPAFSAATWSMSGAAIALVAIGIASWKDDVSQARGLDRLEGPGRLCYAVPLAVFGAEHLSGPQSMLALVPPYMPWRMFWVYLVGLALIAAALSIATRIQVRWSGLLVGSMMFLFVAMLHLPGAITDGGRILWTIVFRELSFGAGGWVLAGSAMAGTREGQGRVFIHVGRALIAMTSLVFGVEHFLHPLGLPGVPLLKQMPPWLPGRAVIDYATGALLIAAGVSFLLARKMRIAAYLGAWIVVLVVAIYGPVLIGALRNTSAGVQIEGINYFADTLLFGGVILSLAAVEQAYSSNRYGESGNSRWTAGVH